MRDRDLEFDPVPALASIERRLRALETQAGSGVDTACWRAERAFGEGSPFLQQLRLGKYTSQFADLTADELLGLLWLLGEYTTRAQLLSTRADEMISPGDRRRVAAHNALLRHRRCTLEQARSLMREANE